mmetsp:Transcript_57678/g.103595  ORF Transcript_57678/g.103595 Transcript_57678/m.103595 type:complete len:297 (+) Transcript_57678:4096-4986(+)
MGWQVHTPGKGRSRNQNLDVPIGVQILHELPVCSRQSGVVDGKAVRQKVLHLWSLHLLGLSLQDLTGGRILLKELGQGVVLHGQISQGLSRLHGLLTRVHEDENLILSSILHQLLIAHLVHGVEALDGLLVRNADVRLLEWHWAVLVAKVEEALLRIHPEEDGDILVVGQRGRETDQTDVLLGGLDLADGSCHNRLKNWTARVMQQVDLIHDDQSDKLRVSTLVPSLAGDDVPLLRRRNDDLCLVDLSLCEVDISTQLADGDSVGLLQALAETCHDFLHQGLHRGHVDNLEARQIK